jgi:hypothetical protein
MRTGAVGCSAKVATDRETVQLWHHDVEDDEVVGMRFGQVLALFAVVSHIDGIPLLRQSALEYGAKPNVIVHDQYAHACISRRIVGGRK